MGITIPAVDPLINICLELGTQPALNADSGPRVVREPAKRSERIGLPEEPRIEARFRGVVRPMRRRTAAGVAGFGLVGLGAAVAVLALALPGGTADALLQFEGHGTASGQSALAPLAAGNARAGIGPCATTERATVVATPSAARGSISVAEPRGCPSRSTLVFLPALTWLDGLSVPVGHTLQVAVLIASIGGTPGLFRSVSVYAQGATGGHAVLTTTSARITRGAITRSESSVGTLAPTVSYGLGIQMTLVKQRVVTTASVSVDLVLTLDDGGTPRAIGFESIAIAFSY